jgi:rod shape-determining protein MreD
VKSKKHIIFYVLSAILLALVQEAFFNDLRILGVKPNLTLVFICITATRMSYMEAVIYGVSTGLFVDIVYGRYIGLYGLLYMYIALAICFATQQISYSEKIWWPIAVSPLPLLLYGIVESFIVRLMSVYAGGAQVLYTSGFWYHVAQRILPVLLYNSICIAVLCLPVIKFLDWKKGGF